MQKRFFVNSCGEKSCKEFLVSEEKAYATIEKYAFDSSKVYANADVNHIIFKLGYSCWNRFTSLLSQTI